MSESKLPNTNPALSSVKHPSEEEVRTPRAGFLKRAKAFAESLVDLRWHDFRAARTWIKMKYEGKPLPVQLWLFTRWMFHQMWSVIPDSLEWAEFARPVSRTPLWLRDGNPYDNYPWAADPKAELPIDAEVVVIGAGFVGAAVAYHWSKLGKALLVIVEMHNPASGSAGRNGGAVVMGRYYYYVHETVLKYLNRARADLSAMERDELAHEFAAAYCRAAYENAAMIERTIREEGIECEYVRKGWVQAADADHQDRLDTSTRMAQERGFTDWVKISAEEVRERSGMDAQWPAGFSIGCASWHPAKWVWGLFRVALQSPHVQLFTQTRVLKVADLGEQYAVHTARGTIYARYVVNATESHTPQLFRDLHNVILPTQTQAAFGESDGGTMQEGVVVSGYTGFYRRHGEGTLFGSDATRVRDDEAGRNQPSRFITKFFLSDMRKLFRVKRLRVTNEWSGTVSYTPDEYPLVGLMDGKRLFMIGGMAGSGSGVSFNGGRHIVWKILGIEGPDYYPEKYFSPARFRKNEEGNVTT